MLTTIPEAFALAEWYEQFVLLLAAAVFIIWMWREIRWNPLPSGPVALGRGFALLIGGPVVAMVAASAAYFLIGFVTALPTYPLTHLIQLAAILGYAGWSACRSREPVGGFVLMLLAGFSFIPYALLVLTAFAGVSWRFDLIALGMYAPLIALGASLARRAEGRERLGVRLTESATDGTDGGRSA